MIKAGKYNRENTNADFDSNLVVEGVVLELQSLTLFMAHVFTPHVVLKATSVSLGHSGIHFFGA